MRLIGADKLTAQERAKRAAEAAQQNWRHDRTARTQLIEWLLLCAPLSDWERGFVSDLANWRTSLTEKQADCMERIVRKYAASACAA